MGKRGEGGEGWASPQPPECADTLQPCWKHPGSALLLFSQIRLCLLPTRVTAVALLRERLTARLTSVLAAGM